MNIIHILLKEISESLKDTFFTATLFITLIPSTILIPPGICYTTDSI